MFKEIQLFDRRLSASYTTEGNANVQIFRVSTEDGAYPTCVCAMRQYQTFFSDVGQSLVAV
jgi:hypothetical protein